MALRHEPFTCGVRDDDNNDNCDDGRDWCPLSRDELESIWHHSNCGVDKALFQKFFHFDEHTHGIPPRCIQCSGLIQQHEYANPERELAALSVRGIPSSSLNTRSKRSKRELNPINGFANLSSDKNSNSVDGVSAMIAALEHVPSTFNATPSENEHFRRSAAVDALRESSCVCVASVLCVIFFCASIAMFILLRDQLAGPAVIGPVLSLVISIALIVLPSRRIVEFDRRSRTVRFSHVRFALFCCEQTEVVEFWQIRGVMVDVAPAKSSQANKNSSIRNAAHGAVMPDYDEDDNNNNDSSAASASASAAAAGLQENGSNNGVTVPTQRPVVVSTPSSSSSSSATASTHNVRLVFASANGGARHSTMLLETVDAYDPSLTERWWLQYLQAECGVVLETQEERKAKFRHEEQLKAERRQRDAASRGRWM